MKAYYLEKSKIVISVMILSLLASFFYQIVFFLFLIPTQIAYSRFGFKYGLYSALISLSLIFLLYCLTFINKELSWSVVIRFFSLPLVLQTCLCIINSKLLLGKTIFLKSSIATIITSLIFIPLIIFVFSNSKLENYISMLLNAQFDYIVNIKNITEEIKNAILEFDVIKFSNSIAQIIRSTIFFFIFIYYYYSWKIGCSIFLKSLNQLNFVPELRNAKNTSNFLWPFAIAWFLVGLSLFISLPNNILGFILWNVAIIISIPYLEQGIGIVMFFLNRISMPKFVRVLIVISTVLIIIFSKSRWVFIITLPLLGFLENWIPFRRLKGDSK